MDGRCETCKWWGDEASRRNVHRTRHSCVLTIVRNEDTPDHPESTAHALAPGAATTELLTAPNFGCVQWERKEQP